MNSHTLNASSFLTYLLFAAAFCNQGAVFEQAVPRGQRPHVQVQYFQVQAATSDDGMQSYIHCAKPHPLGGPSS